MKQAKSEIVKPKPFDDSEDADSPHKKMKAAGIDFDNWNKKKGTNQPIDEEEENADLEKDEQPVTNNEVRL